MSLQWKQRLRKALGSLLHLKPVLEVRYAQESGFYPFGDADGKAVLCRSEGILHTDLRKVTGLLSVFGLLLYLKLRHR